MWLDARPMSDLSTEPLVVSLLLDCDEGIGHSIDYNRSIQRACALNEWKHCAALTTRWSTHLHDAPSTWEICLASPNFTQLRGQPIRQLAGIQRLGESLADYWQQLRRTSAPLPQPVVLLLETFSLSTLAALAYGLQRKRPQQTSVWLLYRGIINLRTAPRQARVYRWLNQRIAAAVWPGNLQLLTDSELLAATCRTLLGRDVQVLPVPHTPPPLPATSSTALNTLRCWWPGAPRAEKGTAIIQTLLASPSNLANHFQIFVAQDAPLTASSHPNAMQLVKLPAHLTRDAYVAQLANSELVLLPYDADAYRERTSGIFIETIVAAKIPVTTKGTWMASELQCHNLPELVIDWHEPTVLDRLATAVRNETIRAKLQAMQRVYARYHNETSLAQVLSTVWQRTKSCST